MRPWSFPASAMPIVVTLAYLSTQDVRMDWGNGLWALVNIILFHAAGNTWSDYFDYRHQVDCSDTYGAKTLTEKRFHPREILWFSILLLSIALLGGIGLLLRSPIELLYIGLAGGGCTLLYPHLKYRAWGDATIFMAYALLPISGTALAVTGTWRGDVLWLAPPIGLITVAILHANNIRDIATDHRASIQTLAMNIGVRASVWVYIFEILFPFLWILACVFIGTLPIWSLLALAAFYPAWMNVRQIRHYPKSRNAQTIANLDERTAQLQLLFSLLLTAALAISTII